MGEAQQNLLANIAISPDIADSSTRRFAPAILADQQCQGESANPILWTAATDDPEPTIRAAAIEHLRNHPVPPSPSRLIPILTRTLTGMFVMQLWRLWPTFLLRMKPITP